MSVSVILTVKNEAATLPHLLDSLMHQSLWADEIVVCDGGSSDETLDILTLYQQWLPIKIISAPGANISEGRNRAIAAATGEVIAGTDGGVVLSPDWLRELVRPIEERNVSVVSGWFEADPYTDFEVVLGATVLPDRDDINPTDFLPSSRSIAFQKAAWAAAGGYPEWLDYCEDLIFDLNLRQLFGSFAFAPNAVAYYRPRRSLRAFARQYYLYARGDGKANLWAKRHLVRYMTYLLALPFIGRLLWQGRKWGWLLLCGGGAAYCRRPAERLWPLTEGWSPAARTRAFALIPIVRLVGDVAKMLGYPVGLIWRWRQRQAARHDANQDS